MIGASETRRTRRAAGFLRLVAPAWIGAALVAGETPQGASFEEVAPIIVARCLGCHNPEAAKGGLVLSTRVGLVEGGDSGPAFSPGNPAESLLLGRIVRGEMPPRKATPLSGTERTRLEAWLRGGASWPEELVLDLSETTTDERAGRDWWAFRAVERPALPAAWRDAHPIDAFIQVRLAERGLDMAPPAGKAQLLRRAHLDLLGLPPSAGETRAFLEDQCADAYERLIDRLLASPHYGERWSRYWLDLVRFAETNGYERDATKPLAWKYRDWVIRSLNEDKPYDTFITEQLAGDELADRREETVVATGMHRLGSWNDEPNDPSEYKFQRLEDMVHTTSTAFLALTVKCARCHDHKFDPIPQTDYYRLASFFWAGPIEPRDRELMGGPSAAELGFDVLGWTDRGRDVPPLRLLEKGDSRRPGRVVEPGFLSLVPALERPLEPPAPGSRTTGRRLQLARWITHPRHPLTARVMVNRIWQHHFGAGLVRTPNNFGFKGAAPSHPELLDWLASEFMAGGWQLKRMHKLIMMSRTYRQSATHPRENEYRLHDPAGSLWWRARRRRLDAEALRDSMLLVSGELQRRMTGPSFHPSTTPEALEGLSRKGQSWGSSPLVDRRRRSVYMFTKRSLLLPLMTTFDFCDTMQPCGERNVTTVPTQALALLNNHFVHEMSAAFARRVGREAGPAPERRVRRAWWLAFGRAPTPAEAAAGLAHLRLQADHFQARAARRSQRENAVPEPGRAADELALASLCHVLLNASEFIYVD